MSKKTLEICLVALGMLMVAIISTYPLIRYFDHAIPYAPYGGPLGWNRTGDMVQLLYWFWLVKENLTGAVPFDTNPYEFNMLLAQDTSGLNTIPLAFLYMLFSPFGDVAAYNCTLFTSYLLAGVFMYLLARLYTGSRAGALLGAIIFTLAPSRIHGVASGHGYGLLFFFYPLILYFLEKGIRSRKIRYGVFSGIGLICLAMLEPHLIYYLCVFLGVFIPVRLVAQLPAAGDEQGEAGGKGNRGRSWSLPFSLLIIWGAGVSAVLYTQTLFVCRDHDPFLTPYSWWIFGIYPLLLILVSACLASVYQRLSSLSLRQSLAVEAASFLPLYALLGLSGVTCLYRPVDTATVVGMHLALVIAGKLFLLRRHLFSMARTLYQGILIRKERLFPVVPLIVAMGLIVAWIASSKIKKISSTIAGGGRTLRDVELFSSHLSDLFISTSHVYLGIIPALLIGYLFLSVAGSALFSKGKETLDDESKLMRLFYMVVGCCSYVLALGLAFGKSSLYILLYHYFPFFNYPRVSDRIMTMVLFAGAISVAFAIKSLQDRYAKLESRGVMVFLLVVLIGVQLKEYNVFRPMGITLLDKGQDVYSHVKENIGDGLLLEIPLWPGDSHQSSLYQHYIMTDRMRRVNGYSPLVSHEYIKTVFTPLSEINAGRLGGQQYELLRKMNVKFITVHNHENVFPRKVSAYGPMTTVRRLMSSPYLEYVHVNNFIHFKTSDRRNDELYLFRVKENVGVEAESESTSWYEMPYFYGVNSRLVQQVGEVVEDSAIGGKVFQALEGKTEMGFLVYGPYDVYSPGDYRCYFTVDRGVMGDGALQSQETIARIEVVKVQGNGDQVVLAQAELSPTGREKSYRREFLDFSIPENTKLEFRVLYHGKGYVRVEQVAVYKKDHDLPLPLLEAERMVGDTGQLVPEQDAGNGQVIEAIVGKSKAGELVYGPNRTYDKGRYLARFYVRTKNVANVKKTDIATILSVTNEQNSALSSLRHVSVNELDEDSFTPIEIEFNVRRDEELSFHAAFTGKASLQLDRIEVIRR